MAIPSTEKKYTLIFILWAIFIVGALFLPQYYDRGDRNVTKEAVSIIEEKTGLENVIFLKSESEGEIFIVLDGDRNRVFQVKTNDEGDLIVIEVGDVSIPQLSTN